jgi:DNA polymerase alpha subunit A
VRRLPPPSRLPRVQDRRKPRALSPAVDEPRHSSIKRLKTGSRAAPVESNRHADDGDDYFNGMDDNDMIMSDPQPSSPVIKAMERKAQVSVKAEEDEEEDDMMDVAQADGIAAASVNMSGTRPIPKLEKPELYPTPASSSPVRPSADKVDASSWNDVTERLNVINSSPQKESRTFGKLDYKDAIEEDGSLRMFWTDYTEINGSLCLFGKVKNKKTGDFVSCFLKIDNILRKLFFLPREFRQKHGRPTTEEVGMKDVYEEVDELMGKMNVTMHKIKGCTRKYAFELPEVPKEADYLKLFYPYTSKSFYNNGLQLINRYCRASASNRSKRRNIFPCLWCEHIAIRAVCSMEEYHGALLAECRRC